MEPLLQFCEKYGRLGSVELAAVGGTGLSGDELLAQFKRVLKGALSWRPETAVYIYQTTGWRRRSDGVVVAPADWQSVCPSDLRTLGQQLATFSWFRGHPDDDYVTATLRENAIFRLYAAIRKCVRRQPATRAPPRRHSSCTSALQAAVSCAFRFKEHKKQPWEPQSVMVAARLHEQKEYERVHHHREATHGGETPKDKKLALYVYLLKKSCTIMNNASTGKATGDDDSGGGLLRRSSGRHLADSDTAKYWELLDRMRPYKTFALRCVLVCSPNRLPWPAATLIRCGGRAL
eukprot:COSAG02_NODE_7572_length_2956_cov_1.241862_2_plen_291_part_00